MKSRVGTHDHHAVQYMDVACGKGRRLPAREYEFGGGEMKRKREKEKKNMSTRKPHETERDGNEKKVKNSWYIYLLRAFASACSNR